MLCLQVYWRLFWHTNMLKSRFDANSSTKLLVASQLNFFFLPQYTVYDIFHCWFGMSPSGIVSKWSNYMSLALNLRLYQCWKSLYRSIWSFRDHHFRKMDGTSLNFTVMFHAIFPFSIHSEFDFRWSPGGGQIGQALARGSRGVLFVAQMDVCKDINEAQRARSSSIWVTWKSWENLGKILGKWLGKCLKYVKICLGSMVGKLMFDKHIFPQQLCGISSGHLWTQCITWGTMGSGGMVQWTKVTLNSGESEAIVLQFYYRFTIVLCYVLLIFPIETGWFLRTAFPGYPEEEQLHVAGQKRGNNGLILIIWGWPDVWPKINGEDSWFLTTGLDLI